MINKVQISIFLVIMTNTLSSQEARYYSKKGTETDIKKAAFIETIYDQPDGHKIYVKQKPNKDSISYITFTSNNPKIRDGKTILYYSSGKQHYVKYYRNNKLSGKLTRYYEDGKIESIVQLDADSILTKKSFDKNGLEVDYISDTKLPRYQNKSMEDFRNFLVRNVYYPQSAINMNISVRCEIYFSINELGKVSDIDVQPDIDIFNKEITRVLNMTDGKWVPGEMYGEQCKIKLSVYLNFINQK